MLNSGLITRRYDGRGIELFDDGRTWYLHAPQKIFPPINRGIVDSTTEEHVPISMRLGESSFRGQFLVDFRLR